VEFDIFQSEINAQAKVKSLHAGKAPRVDLSTRTKRNT
jgi:hypothetical protein